MGWLEQLPLRKGLGAVEHSNASSMQIGSKRSIKRVTQEKRRHKEKDFKVLRSKFRILK